jgi:hypothetical protein
MDNQSLQKQVEDLKVEVEKLKNKRIMQSDILPDVLKQRHIGEGVRFIQSGLAADLPEVNIPMQGQQIFFATDTHTLYVYDGTAWRTQVLT